MNQAASVRHNSANLEVRTFLIMMILVFRFQSKTHRAAMLKNMSKAEFLKQGTPQALAYEAASLEWLDQANGARIVKVLRHDHAGLHLEFLEDGFQSPKAAHEFGAALAATHAAGAPGWGAAPPTWDSEQAFKGLMPMSVVPAGKDFPYQSFGTWLSAQRLQPVAEAAAKHGDLPPKLMARFEKLYHVLQTGEFDSPQPQLVKTPAARLHGDLWAGNLCWTRPGIVLIDPSAYGGHAETDLAECEVFSTPYINEIYAGYQSVSPLSPGWKERLSLHQLYMMTLHLALFGGGYLHAVSRILQQYT
ncbi:fructosamine kinase [Mobiluncus mulieris 28-1]|uniref:fructosamine kinase family protein n=1 Tax=Mobiluncus mulieris TaxID=2052 RepID=UPI0001BE7C62|nr:fructosamine kinase family protein [Mobiluncus mulieris]EEZ91246.1 fructosamine kinase [Mobiluncus mulieris 28-1]